MKRKGVIFLVSLSLSTILFFGFNNKSLLLQWISYGADLATIITLILLILENSKDEKNVNTRVDSSISNFGTNNDWIYEKYYEEFIGRLEYRRDLISFFSETQGDLHTLLLHSFGGYGKTALCRKVLEDLYERKIYQGFIWLQNKNKTYDIKNNILHDELPRYTNYESLISDTFTKLKLPDGFIMNLNDKESKLTEIFSKHKLLLIIDGIEDTKKSEDLITKFLGLFTKESKTKLLINSRDILDINAKYIELLKFTPKESLDFMKSFVSEKLELSKYFNNLSPDRIEKMIQITSGNPLLIKVFLSHLHYGEYSDVFDSFSNFKYDGLNDYLLPSWKRLNKENPLAVDIMRLLARNPIGLTSDLIGDYFPEIEKILIENSLRLLGNLSFLEINITQNSRKFKLHSFIEGFVNSQDAKK